LSSYHVTTKKKSKGNGKYQISYNTKSRSKGIKKKE
jgi:hypothetical protein